MPSHPPPIRTAARRGPQIPGSGSKTPATGPPHSAQRPSGASRQRVILYQSRPMTQAPQPGQ